MNQFQPDAQEIAEILEDAIAAWKLSHEQLARSLGCTKESVENWLKRKCRPRPHALRAIEQLRDHLQDGNPLPPKLDVAKRPRNRGTPLTLTGGLSTNSPYATEAAATVRRFFEAIDAKQHGTAWKCLTPGFQERRWPHGLAEFTSGYQAFIGLSNLVVAPLQPILPPACRVFVYYEDMTTVLDLPGSGGWSTAQLGQIEECCQAIVRVRDALLARVGANQAVIQVQVSSLFTEQAGNVLQDASKLPGDAFFDTAGVTTTRQCLLSVPLIAKVLRVQKGRFLIDQLLPVQWGKRVPGRT